MTIRETIAAAITLCVAISMPPRTIGQDAAAALPTSNATAKIGEYVLCPSRQFYDAAIEKGFDKSTFIYYAAVMVAPGGDE